uniref:Uncharacterized protein n=1 Tax=Oryza meridionalis TaxID=40149 RepID=A0A0E0CSM4_9ORYZ
MDWGLMIAVELSLAFQEHPEAVKPFSRYAPLDPPRPHNLKSLCSWSLFLVKSTAFWFEKKSQMPSLPIIKNSFPDKKRK